MSNILQTLLRSSGYVDELPSSVDRIVRVSEMTDFFTWLETNVGSGSIVNIGEIQTQRALQQSDALIEDGSQLSARYNALFTGETNVYPHWHDLLILESTKQQLTKNLESWEQFDKKTRSLEGKLREEKENPVEPTINQLLASEKQQIDGLVSTQLEEIFSLASSADRLRFEPLKAENELSLNQTVAVPSAELLCYMELLNEYLMELIKHSLQNLEQHYSSGFDDAELKLVFNECIRLQRIEIALEAQNSGILAVLEAFTGHTLFEPLTSCFSEVSDDEIDSICHHKARLTFCKGEVNFAPADLESRQQILDHLNRLADIAEPLRLCGDSIVRLALSTRKWMKKTDALHSQIRGQLEEACTRIRMNRERLNAALTIRKFHDARPQSQNVEHHWKNGSVLEHSRPVDRVQQYVNEFSQYKSHFAPVSLQNSNIASVHDSGVSSLSHLDQLTAGSQDVANSTARSDWLFARPASPLLPSSCLQNSIIFSEPTQPELGALRHLAVFFKDSQTTFSSIKSVIESVFKGASPSFDEKMTKSIIESVDRLMKIWQQLNESRNSWISFQDACRYCSRSRLVKMFWYFYYRDPENLIRAVKCLEEVADSFQRPVADGLTPPPRHPRCSLLDNLENRFDCPL